MLDATSTNVPSYTKSVWRKWSVRALSQVVSSIKIVYLVTVEIPEESPKAKAGALATSVLELDQIGLRDSKEDKCLVNNVPALVNLVPSANP